MVVKKNYIQEIEPKLNVKLRFKKGHPVNKITCDWYGVTKIISETTFIIKITDKTQ